MEEYTIVDGNVPQDVIDDMNNISMGNCIEIDEFNRPSIFSCINCFFKREYRYNTASDWAVNNYYYKLK